LTLDEIFDLWKEDCDIDRQDLGQSALDIAKLHHKYYRIFSQERLTYKKIESEVKRLKLEKYEFFTDGPTEEQIEKGWVLPAKGRILKSDVNMYLDSDKEIINMNLKLAYQMEKLELLESIIKTITNRGFQIRAAIDWAKFQTGG
jgi:hypothetical protein